jgi:hypothetical protein
MQRAVRTFGHIVWAVTSPIRGLLSVLLGLGALLALFGVAGTLLGAAVLHILSPHATVSPLLRLAGLAALGGVAFVSACALPIALLKRR